jgi:peptidoglycan/xylan/chitin deacetylase (PgdA/CDA1 family)
MSTAVRAALAMAGAAERLVPPRLSTLIFHRVLPEPDPLFPGEIDSRRFDRLMALVRSGFRVLPFGEALALHQEGRLPARALAVTFDDGYADNAEIALPALQRLGLRASFFVATGFLDGGRMFNDSVIECIRRCDRPEIDLSDLGLDRRPLGDAAARRRLIDAVLPAIKYRPLEAREEALDRLHRAAGRPALPADLMMRSEQVRPLHRAGMEIGGHTVNHPILCQLADPQARDEIARGRRVLQDLTGAPVDVFAYPNGKPDQDYDARHVAMVRELGFRGAVSTAAGVGGAGSDPFQWPRFTPWDPDPARWGLRLLWQRWRSPRAAVAQGSS